MSAPADGCRPAPGGLRFVQDLVNTAAGRDPGPDPIQDAGRAGGWLREALGAWSAATGQPPPGIELDDSDLAPLRDHRELLRVALRVQPGSPSTARSAATPDSPVTGEVTARVLLTSTPGGLVRYEPFESGWRAVRGPATTEALLAQVRGTWPRLKVCAYPACGVCFYDASPNRTRVWHDTRTCGNRANLRASRARK
jgi:predicted RNA-binding Zn ribbon-like protein